MSIQNCPQLSDLSGLNNLVTAGSIVLAQLPVTTMPGFNNLFSASDLWLYRNSVSYCMFYYSLHVLDYLAVESTLCVSVLLQKLECDSL